MLLAGSGIPRSLYQWASLDASGVDPALVAIEVDPVVIDSVQVLLVLAAAGFLVWLVGPLL